MKGTYEGFKEFVAKVAKETPNKELNHDSWCNCSVGEYARSVGDNIHNGNDIHYAGHLLPQNVNFDLSDKLWARDHIPTYGKLHKYLESVEKIVKVFPIA